ncbi:patatin-like phospholipase family protein [Labrys monachus]|uniref:NTE family protein n=1 Tax=Labrys monachus TaxID=217067 RepID=A0ABU0FKE9_9HYPH|nr:patatin-like phospholipase family protein [Labrys monachus]MDQ0394966.1 NTE family protein [Labrys monachus]
MGAAPAGPTVALALGGGGARGLAHVAMLEAFDELGVRPVALAGTSMGAIFAAAYASGLSAAEIREHTLALLADRRGLRGKLLAARSGRFADLFSHMGNPVMVDAEALCDAFLPEAVAQDFARCTIPLTVVATDFHARREKVFTAGPLRRAVAASMAIPGLVRPVTIGSDVLIDGATTNPLPIDHIAGKADILVGIDVTGAGSSPRSEGPPGAWAALFGALQIMQAAIIEEKMLRHRPDILIRPNVGAFGGLDFALSSAIFRLARPAKDELKRRLAALLERR